MRIRLTYAVIDTLPRCPCCGRPRRKRKKFKRKKFVTQ
jgi:hypothetical protein